MAKGRFILGSITNGTLRPDDLIDTFAAELRRIRGALPVSIANGIRSIPTRAADDAAELQSELITELQDALNAYAPSYGYFGAHPGDGSDFGFWISEDWREQARDSGAIEVKDTADVPATYSGEVIHINDHGNATLYAARRGKLREVWSIV